MKNPQHDYYAVYSVRYVLNGIYKFTSKHIFIRSTTNISLTNMVGGLSLDLAILLLIFFFML